ncbi:MAG: PaaI family thioesterase [Parvularculaceae bacterium]
MTSARHTKILNDFLAGEGAYAAWANEGLGPQRLVGWSPGALSLEWTIEPDMVLPDGVMFGGRVAAMADHVTSLVAMTALAADDMRFRTSRLDTSFFRPIKQPRIDVAARVVNVSARLIHVEADFLNVDGKICARSCAVQSRRTSRDGPAPDDAA